MTNQHNVRVPCLWFFIPLPHPIGLPSGWNASWLMSPEDLDRFDSPTTGVSCSLRAHQIVRSWSPLVADTIDIFRYASGVAGDSSSNDTDEPSHDNEEPPFSLASLDSHISLVEATVPSPLPHDAAAVDDALDFALTVVQGVQRAIAELNRTPIRLVNRAHLPPMIPIFSGEVTLGASSTGPPRFIPHFIEGSAAPPVYGLAPAELDRANVEKLARVINQLATGYAFGAASDLIREALTQYRLDGNARSTIATLATAAEVLLNTLLLHLVWEEGWTPTSAADIFSGRQGHRGRVAQYIAPRLGGGWDATGDGPVGHYFKDLVRLRNRVVHAGHIPTPAELAQAWDAYRALERFIGDRLSDQSKLYKYPRTAFVWCGETGLRRRGRWSARFRNFVEDPSQPNWIRSFSRWRFHVDRASDPAPPQPGTDVTRIRLYYEVRGGKPRWALHDPVTDSAAINFDPDELTYPAQREALRMISKASGGELVRSAVQFKREALPQSLSWVPAGEIFPEETMNPGAPPTPRRS
jgi:hypothetical protein